MGVNPKKFVKMSAAKTLKSINDYVCNFLMEEIGEDTELIDKWNSKEIQSELSKVFPKSSKEDKVKDPNKPKRGKSAYLFFCEDKREEVKQEFEDSGGSYSTKDVTCKLAKLWNELKEDPARKSEMEGYEEKAQEAKEKYDSEMAGYVPPTDQELKKESKKKKDPNAPKRAKSSYLFFCEKNRDKVKMELENPTPTEITRELGNRWQDLTSDSSTKARHEMKEYVALAEKDKERYTKEIAAYSSPVVAEEKKPVKVAKPARKISGYALFCKDYRDKLKEENPESSGAEITRLLGIMWKDLAEEVKEEWKTRASGGD